MIAAAERPAAALGTIELPQPSESIGTDLAQAIHKRRSAREYDNRDLSWGEIGQLLWAAQGITERAASLRASPSAGALFPLEVDVATREGVFRYRPSTHAVAQRMRADVRADLAYAAYEQIWVTKAAAVFAIAAVTSRTARRYGSRAQRYVQLETGHAAQNVLLMAAGLNLGGTPVGAFDDDAVGRVLRLRSEETPLYLIPVGARQ